MWKLRWWTFFKLNISMLLSQVSMLMLLLCYKRIHMVFCFLGFWFRKLIWCSFPGKHTNLTGWMNGFWLVIHMWSLVRSLESAYSVGGTNLSVFNQYQRTTKLPRLSSYKNSKHETVWGRMGPATKQVKSIVMLLKRASHSKRHCLMQPHRASSKCICIYVNTSSGTICPNRISPVSTLV